MTNIFRRLHINPLASYTLGFHLPAMFFAGFVQGINGLNDIILRKTLKATPEQITLLTMILSFSMLVSLFWGEQMRSKPKRGYFLVAGMISRGSFLLMLFVKDNPYHYLIVQSIFMLSASVMIPVMNTIWQNNYTDRVRGRLYGFGVTIQTIMVILVSFATGRLLDVNDNWFRIIFAIAGIAGFIEMGIWSQLKIEGEVELKNQVKRPHRSIKRIFSESMRILKLNPEFMRFEGSFMLYGFAFMCIIPVIPIYLVDNLNLSYSDASMAKVTIANVGLLLSPLFGYILDKMTPMRFVMIACLFLAMFPIFLIAASKHLILVYVAFGFWGVGMAMINLAWNLSSIFFAGKDEAAPLQGAHASLVGIRGLLGPVLGYLIMRFFNINAVFVLSSGLFLAGAIGMILHDLDHKRKRKLQIQTAKT